MVDAAPDLEVLPWEAHFPAAQESISDAKDFLSRFVLVWSAQVYYVRNLLPDDAFQLHCTKDLQFRSFEKHHHQLGKDCARGILSVCQTIYKHPTHVRKLFIVLREFDDNREDMYSATEVHSLTFHYGSTLMIEMAGSKHLGLSPSKIAYNGPQSVRDGLANLLDYIRELNHTLRPLPRNMRASFQVLFNEAAPSRYVPENWYPVAKLFHFPKKPYTVHVGTLSTKHHRVDAQVRSVYVKKVRNRNKLTARVASPAESATAHLKARASRSRKSNTRLERKPAALTGTPVDDDGVYDLNTSARSGLDMNKLEKPKLPLRERVWNRNQAKETDASAGMIFESKSFDFDAVHNIEHGEEEQLEENIVEAEAEVRSRKSKSSKNRKGRKSTSSGSKKSFESDTSALLTDNSHLSANGSLSNESEVLEKQVSDDSERSGVAVQKPIVRYSYEHDDARPPQYSSSDGDELTVSGCTEDVDDNLERRQTGSKSAHTREPARRDENSGEHPKSDGGLRSSLRSSANDRRSAVRQPHVTFGATRRGRRRGDGSDRLDTTRELVLDSDADVSMHSDKDKEPAEVEQKRISRKAEIAKVKEKRITRKSETAFAKVEEKPRKSESVAKRKKKAKNVPEVDEQGDCDEPPSAFDNAEPISDEDEGEGEGEGAGQADYREHEIQVNVDGNDGQCSPNPSEEMDLDDMNSSMDDLVPVPERRRSLSEDRELVAEDSGAIVNNTEEQEAEDVAEQAIIDEESAIPSPSDVANVGDEHEAVSQVAVEKKGRIVRTSLISEGRVVHKRRITRSSILEECKRQREETRGSTVVAGSGSETTKSTSTLKTTRMDDGSGSPSLQE